MFLRKLVTEGGSIRPISFNNAIIPLARCGNAPPMQRNWMRHWMKPVEWSQAVWSRQIPTACPYSPESPHQTSGERWQVVRNGHSKLWTKGTHSMDISEWCHAWNHGKASSKALSPLTWQRKLPAWSYGQKDSSPWTPVCTISVLTNTSQLAQRTPGQPGRHSTGYVHRLAGQEWTCWSRDFPTNKKPVTVASGRPCNTYWSAPWWTLPALPMTWQWLMASPLAVPGIGRARFDEHTTPGGRTRMMMTTGHIMQNHLFTLWFISCCLFRFCGGGVSLQLWRVNGHLLPRCTDAEDVQSVSELSGGGDVWCYIRAWGAQTYKLTNIQTHKQCTSCSASTATGNRKW